MSVCARAGVFPTDGKRTINKLYNNLNVYACLHSVFFFKSSFKKKVTVLVEDINLMAVSNSRLKEFINKLTNSARAHEMKMSRHKSHLMVNTLGQGEAGIC